MTLTNASAEVVLERRLVSEDCTALADATAEIVAAYFVELAAREGPSGVTTNAAAGVSVGLVAWLYEQGGFASMLRAFAGLCLLVVAAAIILPREIRTPAADLG